MGWQESSFDTQGGGLRGFGFSFFITGRVTFPFTQCLQSGQRVDRGFCLPFPERLEGAGYIQLGC